MSTDDATTTPFYRARKRARHLKALLWGQPEGPAALSDLPEPLRPVARTADRIGDDLARFREALYADDLDAGSAIPQVRLVAEVLAEQVVPSNLDDLPDRGATWVRSELEGERFDASALDAALVYYAEGGEPNVFRSRAEDEPLGRPALRDVRALQLLARELTETARGAASFGVTPVQLVEDFVRMHWSNAPETRGLVGIADTLGEPGGRDPWEEHPLGLACFEAVRQVQHLPAEDAEYEAPTCEPRGPATDGPGGRDRGWSPPAP